MNWLGLLLIDPHSGMGQDRCADWYPKRCDPLFARCLGTPTSFSHKVSTHLPTAMATDSPRYSFLISQPIQGIPSNVRFTDETETLVTTYYMRSYKL
jgi:hypothetical protein